MDRKKRARARGQVAIDTESPGLIAFGNSGGWQVHSGNPLDDLRAALGLGTTVEKANVQFHITEAVQLSLDRAGVRGYVLRWRVEEPNYPEVLVPQLNPDVVSRITEELRKTGVVGIGIDLADHSVNRRQVNMAMSFGEPVTYERIVIGAPMMKLGRKAPDPPPTLDSVNELGAQLDVMKLP